MSWKGTCCALKSARREGCSKEMEIDIPYWVRDDKGTELSKRTVKVFSTSFLPSFPSLRFECHPPTYQTFSFSFSFCLP